MPVKKIQKTQKPKKQELKRVESLTLTLQDRFYIENHGELSLEQISIDLGKPIDIIESFAKTLINKEKRSRGKKAFQSDPKKGYVAMNEASSMVVDEANKKYVTTEAINKAMVEGNHELVRELKARYDEQQRVTKETIRKKYNDKIHYIQPIDDDEDIF